MTGINRINTASARAALAISALSISAISNFGTTLISRQFALGIRYKL